MIAPKVPPHVLTDDVAAHRWVVHGDGSACEDGCDALGDPERVRAYQDAAGPYDGPLDSEMREPNPPRGILDL